ncbi:protein of unknown function [Pseudomonas sp. JV551A1]|uniref:Uncharacterized protein n=1 Tax=Pseudomonas inefficax TaxID=2078786 RepID=A0AAQ1SSJ6_9PSED|nr:protein of unknown function [Pseudomonas sp. JV551A1]SPO59937.1 protein of unknown function [Pseudomonas inefficax]
MPDGREVFSIFRPFCFAWLQMCIESQGLFAGEPAPTGIRTGPKLALYLWERVYPRRGPISHPSCR